MLDIGGIARQLGGSALLGAPIASHDDLERLVKTGIPKPALLALVSKLSTGSSLATQIHVRTRLVSNSSFRRHSNFKGALAERIIRIANVRALAEKLIGNEKGANEFLFRDHPELGYISPFEAARSSIGARATESVLESAAWGLPV